MYSRFIAIVRNACCTPTDKQEGQGMAEYGLILAGVVLLAIVAVFLLGPKIGQLLNTIGSSLS